MNLRDNASVTDVCNRLSPGLMQFMQKAISINRLEHRPFSCLDFKSFSRTNFRQYIYRLPNNIEVAVKGRPTLYKVKGIELAGDSHRITQRVTGDMPEFDHLLESLRDQPPMIHDIHLKFESDLHSKLTSIGYSVNPSNHVIKNIRYTSIDNNINTKILIYPKTTQVIIGCTYKPIIYNIPGVYSLFSHLAQVQYYLSQLAKHEATIPEVAKWIVKRYDFNKDSSMSVSAQPFWYEFADAATGLIRFYLKKMPNKETIARLEQIRTPNQPMKDILEDLLRT